MSAVTPAEKTQELEAAAERAIRSRLREWWSRLALLWRVLIVAIPTAAVAAGASWAASPHSTIGDHEKRISVLEVRAAGSADEYRDLRDQVREQTRAIQAVDRTVERMSGRLDEMLRAIRGEP